MTVTQLVEYFDLLQDKYGSPYFTTAEKESFLNQAELDIVLDHLPKDGDEQNIERNANTWMIFNPLFYPITTTMDVNGAISRGSIETSILTPAIGFSTRIIRPLSITLGTGSNIIPVKGPIRYNNWATYMRNSFKAPSTDNPKYYESSTHYYIYPVDTSATVTLNVLRYPRGISVSGGFTSELPAIFHGEIIARALEFAGVGSRDQMLAELQKINNV